ncbi:MAG TPA: TonB-dependent receptor [Ignavibacteria bacterium]|nr:TonB-dependent receptor [Ignavibacteria bacterium]
MKKLFVFFVNLFFLSVIIGIPAFAGMTSQNGILRFAQNDTSKDDDSTTTIETETIEVDALRGVEGITPITFENIDREQIEERYWMEDLPMFLKGTTSINTYSESGSSVGYSYLTLRGFDQHRLSIMINGIPQNDPEDHQVYWVDISDLTASVENIQIQRGIGTALYGSSSIGGVINIQTIDYFKHRFLNLKGGYGNYNSKRYSLEYSSGNVANGFGFYGKFTKINTDGYRDLSWSDHMAYFFSAGKMIGNHSIVKLNFYGGPIKNHLAYLGVTRDYLDGQVTGDKLVDRRYNFITFPNESDNYNQPHYELIFNTQPSKNLFISNTFSYIRGEGYFVTNFPAYYGYDFSYFRLNPYYVPDSTLYNPAYYRRNPDGSFYYDPALGYEIITSDIVTNLYVNNDTYGWFPKLKWNHSNNGSLVVGGEVRFHKSEHYGEITFGDALPQGTPVNYQYYYYQGGKRTFSIFANEVYELTPQLTGMLGVQYVNHQYKISKDKFKPYDFTVNYNFVTPRLGLNYKFTNNFRTFANISYARREPRLKDIYDAESPYSTPNFRVVDPATNTYEDPLIKPEDMLDFELGFGYDNEKLNTNLNFYWMDFRNEIVNNGQLDNVGQPIVGNAGKSTHRGIELELHYQLLKNLSHEFGVSGNLNLSQNFFNEYIEVLGVDSTGNIIYGNNYSDNKILLTPDIIGNLSLHYKNRYGFTVYVNMQSVGKQYLDNSENDRKNPSARNVPGYVDKVIEPYNVFNAGISFDLMKVLNYKQLSKFDLSLKVNNIFDKLYETYGSVDGSGTPYWIPAATRNVFFELTLGL